MTQPLSPVTRPPATLPVDPAAPTADAVRAALARLQESDALRAAPQLAAFLAFVVEARLRGEAGRIKGYTIAVEVLGRPSSFDPATDSIVRVVAGRLRRVLGQYYDSTGADDAVVIDMPRGTYVPRFHLRHPPPPVAPAGPAPEAAAALARRGPPPRIGPAILVERFDATGLAQGSSLTVGRLQRKLADAIARFDAITVMTDAVAPGHAAPGADYRLGGHVEYHLDGTITLDFQLTDASDGTLVMARMFTRLPGSDDPGATEDAVVRAMTLAIGDPLGGLWARERTVHALRDPHRACVVEVIEYWRHFDPTRQEAVREAVEFMLSENPGFATGYVSLAFVHYRDHLLDIVPPGGVPVLDLALRAAQQAVELRPHSGRAHDMLGFVWFARGELDLALGAVARAQELNPYDTNIIASHGLYLLASGQREAGAAMLRRAAAHTVVRPAWFDFFLFLAAHLDDDAAGAAQHGALIVGDGSPLGLLAQALLAGGSGDVAAARQAMAGLAAFNPGWRSDPLRQLAKLFPAPEIQHRLLRDLEAALTPEDA